MYTVMVLSHDSHMMMIFIPMQSLQLWLSGYLQELDTNFMLTHSSKWQSVIQVNIPNGSFVPQWCQA